MSAHETRFQFNPKRCRDFLSPFGKNVLDALIKMSDQAGSKNKSQRPSQIPRRYRADRVLMFGDSNFIASSVAVDPSECQSENVKTINKEIFCNVDCSEELPAVPTSDELVCTFPIREELLNDDTKDKNRDSFLSTVSLINDTYNINYVGEDCDFISHSTHNQSNAIDWNNMFDTDLLKAASNNVINDTNLKQKSKVEYLNVNVLENTSKIQEEIAISSRVQDETKLAVGKILKRKNQTKLTDNNNFKKVKKKSTAGNKIPKTSFRKEKYTKSVKNWLNNVTSCDMIANLNPENHIISNQNDIDTNTINDNVTNFEINKNNSEIINIRIEHIDKTKKATKVIQAQLTNKGGVMKYGKPKSDELDPGKMLTENSTNKIEEKENNVKDKKTKSKFVAPIKSQIPVRYVTYDISTVEMNNHKEVLKKMRDELFSEVFITLVYTNGFSQLNCHHTDDTCIPEGILMLANENLYYLKLSGEIWVEEIINELLSNTIICYDGKSLLLILMSQNYLKPDKFIEIHDVKIGGSLIDPDNPPETFADLQKLLNYVPQYTIATECNLQKSVWYLMIFKECANTLETLLKENSLWNVFIQIEMRLLPIIAGMENKGVSVDIEKLKSMESVLLTKIKTVEQQCHKVAGKTFQINSTVQVRAILYDELKLDSKCNIKIRETISKGAKSTSESMLRSLMSVHPLPKLILEYRHLYKAHATFLAGIAQHVRDGMVKPNWVQTAAATGRIASNNPNLQAIPKAPFSHIMYPEGNDIELNQQLNFRSVYVSRAGYELLAADFKHIECRVFAYVASDTGLLDALKSRDLFRVLAAKWLGKDESEISSEDRERTKRIVYANLYGAGVRKLMDILGVNYDQALSVVATFNRTFPSLKHFGRSVVARCERNSGRLTTVCGRARTLQHIASDDFALKSHAERQAINFIVQGSAADLCKLAMVETEKRLRLSSRRLECHLVLQLHDELVWEVAAEDLATAAGIIKEVMENCGRQCGMDISLPVAMAHGPSWGEMTELFAEE